MENDQVRHTTRCDTAESLWVQHMDQGFSDDKMDIVHGPERSHINLCAESKIERRSQSGKAGDRLNTERRREWRWTRVTRVGDYAPQRIGTAIAATQRRALLLRAWPGSLMLDGITMEPLRAIHFDKDRANP